MTYSALVVEIGIPISTTSADTNFSHGLQDLWTATEEQAVSFKKIIQRVVPSSDPLSDFVAIIDVIEVQLGIQTGQPSMSERLDGLLTDVRRGAVIGDGQVEMLRDAIGRLREVEILLADFWRGGQPSEEPGS
jgi:hypothetical protein